MSQKLSLSLLGLLLLSSSLDAQNPTLRQLAVETQGHIGVSTLGCGPDPTLQSILSGKDVAIEGTVLSKRGYATADDREIFTDYGFAVSQVILQRKLFSYCGRRIPRRPLDIISAERIRRSRRNSRVLVESCPF